MQVETCSGPNEYILKEDLLCFFIYFLCVSVLYRYMCI